MVSGDRNVCSSYISRLFVIHKEKCGVFNIIHSYPQNGNHWIRRMRNALMVQYVQQRPSSRAFSGTRNGGSQAAGPELSAAMRI